MNMFLLLLIFFLFPSHVYSLRCVAAKNYSTLTRQYPDEFSNTSVDNTIIERCKITIELHSFDQTIQIKYFGEDILNETSDLINVDGAFLRTMNLVGIDRFLTVVCSWEDLCDRKYVENWSQWFLKLNFTDIQNEIDQYFQIVTNKDYSSNICYDMDQVTICPNIFCYSSNDKNRIISKCAQEDEMPTQLKTVLKFPALLIREEFIYVNIQTKDLLENFEEPVDHSISYFCISNQCNDPSIAAELARKIKAKYHLPNMTDFISSISEKNSSLISMNTSTSTIISDPNSTSIPDSTSTEIKNTGNRCYSMLFIAFVSLLLNFS